MGWESRQAGWPAYAAAACQAFDQLESHSCIQLPLLQFFIGCCIAPCSLHYMLTLHCTSTNPLSLLRTEQVISQQHPHAQSQAMLTLLLLLLLWLLLLLLLLRHRSSTSVKYGSAPTWSMWKCDMNTASITEV